MTEFSSDQAHLDADVDQVTQALTQIQQEFVVLQAQISANPSAPASTLDFTRLDALVKAAAGDQTVDLPPSPSANAIAADNTSLPFAPGPLAQSVGSVPSTIGDVPVDTSPTLAGSPLTQPTAGDVVTGAGSGDNPDEGPVLPTQDPNSLPTPVVDPTAASSDTSAAADPAAATTSAPEPGLTTGQPTAAPAIDAATLYRHVGTDTFDDSVWLDSGKKNAAGDELYTFTGDTAPGETNGVSADWVVDTAAA